jgi:tetratricopeptide (TPR) repeat protein
MNLVDIAFVRPLGQGGMGRVWQVKHPEHGVPLALKLMAADIGLDAQRAASIEREMGALAGLNHPGIVHLLDWGFVTDSEAAGQPHLEARSPWLLTECVHGRPLLEVLVGFEWSRFRSALVDLLDTFAHLHARGWVHRDISPGNVLWSLADSRPKLIDFGLSAIQGVRGPSPGGTVGFSAPEQRTGGAIGPWTDLFSFGCLVQESLARRTKPIKCPEHFEAWLQRLTHLDPNRRFLCAADAKRGLLNQEITLSELPPREETVEQVRPSLQWRRPSASLFPFRDVAIVGREPEQDQLWAILNRAMRGEGMVICSVEGPRGEGLSRLMLWLGRKATALGVGELVNSGGAMKDVRSSVLPIWILTDPDKASLESVANLDPTDRGLVLLERPNWAGGLSVHVPPLPSKTHGAMVRAFLPVSPAVCGWVLAEVGGNPAAVHACLVSLLDGGLLQPKEGLLSWVPDREPAVPSVKPEELESALDALVPIVEAKELDLAWWKSRGIACALATSDFEPAHPDRFRLWKIRADLAQELNHRPNLLAVIEGGRELLSVHKTPQAKKMILRRLVSVQRRVGLLEASVQDAKSLLETVEGTPYSAKATWEMAYCLGLQGAFRSSKEGFEKAIELADRFADALVHRHGLAGLALALSWLGDFDEALEVLDRAELEFIQGNAQSGLANLTDLRGSFYLGKNQLSKARKSAVDSVAAYVDQGRLSPLIPLINLAAVEHALGKRIQVEVLLDQVGRLARGREDRLFSVITLYQLIYAAQDRDWEQWEAYWKEHMHWWDKAPEWHPGHGRLLLEMARLLDVAEQRERSHKVALRLHAQFDHVGWEVARAWGVVPLV